MYVFSSRIRSEIEAIGREGEEVTAEDSYFPYMRELRLSKKSPYTSSANVNLHNWVSFFCALLGSSRSFNARIVSESGLVHSLNLALFAAKAFKQYVSPTIVFGYEAQAAEAREIADVNDDSDSSLNIDPSSPLGVYRDIIENGNTVPQSLMSIFEQTIRSLGAARANTIGEFLRSHILTNH